MLRKGQKMKINTNLSVVSWVKTCKIILTIKVLRWDRKEEEGVSLITMSDEPCKMIIFRLKNL